MLREKIERKIEEKAMKYGFMGTEPVSVGLELTDIEKEEFWEMDLEDNYFWEIKGNTLYITYIEDIEDREEIKWKKIEMFKVDLEKNISNKYFKQDKANLLALFFIY